MQWVTHLGIGVLAGRWVEAGGNRSRGRVLFALFGAAGSHVLLDDLARATYHPHAAHLGDPVWLGFMASALLAGIVLAVRARRQWPYLVAACFPDLDWIVARPLGWWPPGALHAGFRAVPGIEMLSVWLRRNVPDWRERPEAMLVELTLLGVLFWWARRLSARATKRVELVAKRSPTLEAVFETER